jgi:hypothetical protein
MGKRARAGGALGALVAEAATNSPARIRSQNEAASGV